MPEKGGSKELQPPTHPATNPSREALCCANNSHPASFDDLIETKVVWSCSDLQDAFDSTSSETASGCTQNAAALHMPWQRHGVCAFLPYYTHTHKLPRASHGWILQQQEHSVSFCLKVPACHGPREHDFSPHGYCNAQWRGCLRVEQEQHTNAE
eukprot:2150887-Rhodomonas_salina.2